MNLLAIWTRQRTQLGFVVIFVTFTENWVQVSDLTRMTRDIQMKPQRTLCCGPALINKAIIDRDGHWVQNLLPNWAWQRNSWSVFINSWRSLQDDGNKPKNGCVWNQSKFLICSVHLALLQCQVLQYMDHYDSPSPETKLDGEYSENLWWYMWLSRKIMFKHLFLNDVWREIRGNFNEHVVVVQSCQLSSI